jgi:c-di-GMP-binding flagellar brake protein YcgR
MTATKPPTQKRRIIERRKHPRIFTPSDVLFSFKRLIEPVEIEGHTEGEGALIDLSLGGCRLHSDIPLEITGRYHLILQVSKKPRPIIVETAVVRWTQENAYGLKFTSMQSIHESHLRELLLDLRRPAP